MSIAANAPGEAGSGDFSIGAFLHIHPRVNVRRRGEGGASCAEKKKSGAENHGPINSIFFHGLDLLELNFDNSEKTAWKNRTDENEIFAFSLVRSLEYKELNIIFNHIYIVMSRLTGLSKHSNLRAQSFA